MQAAKYTVTSPQMLNQVYRDCMAAIEDHGFIKVEWKAGSVRTMDQNSLYWKWMGEMADYVNARNRTEFTKDDLHMKMRHMYLGYRTKKVGNDEITELTSTTSLTRGEMYYFMQQVEAYAGQIGCMLTIPSESEYMRLKEKENQ